MGRDKKFTGFVLNSLELMEDIKFALLRLQWSSDDTAIASTIPCATSAIKELDSFRGCKHLVTFTCVIEGVLSRVRDAELRIDAKLFVLLQSCCDHVSDMVRQLATSDTEQCFEKTVGHLEKSLGLILQLRAYAPVLVSVGNRNGPVQQHVEHRRHLTGRHWGRATH